MDRVYMTPLSELNESNRKCWDSKCKKTAWLEDWCGWRWCFYHFYRSWKWGHAKSWFYLKNVKLYIYKKIK